MSASAFVFYGAAGIACILSAIWVGRPGGVSRLDRAAAIAAFLASASWFVSSAAFGMGHHLAEATEILANLGWIYALFRLFANDGRDENLVLVRPAIVAIALVETLQFALLFVPAQPDGGISETLVFETSSILRVLVAVGALVLVHNLHLGAERQTRILLRWSAGGLLAIWAFSLNFHLLAWLTGTTPQTLEPFYALTIAIASLVSAVGFRRSTSSLQFRPSRTATFHFLSLLLIVSYAFALALTARWLDAASADTARMLQVGTMVIAASLLLIWMPSRRARAWLRVTALKHLFEHRYDYRAEWLRFTQTIARGKDGSSDALPERAIEALADLTGSPGGLLFMHSEDQGFSRIASRNWGDQNVLPRTLPAPLISAMERDGRVIDLPGLRKGARSVGCDAFCPDWLINCDSAWAAVPLIHFDRLVGVIVLAMPAHDHRLDWEDFDIMKIVGRQLASYLAEQAGQAALLEASRFDEFNRRMAFVMHDIKNLASQMSLLTRNAEKHADNPEFRRDMMLTVRNSADKLNTLLARLGRYGTTATRSSEAFDMRGPVVAVTTRLAGIHPLTLIRSEEAKVCGQIEGLEQALTHLVQNAIDASDAESAVAIETFSDGLYGRICVIDSGVGMSPAFLREGLFKPFVSTKDGGFGIGAFEARETIRAMGGQLDVDSREGLGTRFTISLPLESARPMLEIDEDKAREAA
ncbi:PEP-CTERM system histidine kinase PrsK [Erythrobacter litoralis]|nr:PEP-CTERM system histidine kinase PrsK [Erythrobacter litoralis]